MTPAWAADMPVPRGITVQLKQGTTMQTIAEMWEQQGIEKGRREGTKAMCELVTRLLVRRFGRVPVAAKKRLLSAEASDLLRWAENIDVAANLDEVFTDPA